MKCFTLGNSETAYRLQYSTRRSHQSTAHAVELFNKNLVEAILQTQNLMEEYRPYD